MSKIVGHRVSLFSNDRGSFIPANFEKCCLSVLGCKNNAINVSFTLKDKELRIQPDDSGVVLEHPSGCPCRFLTTTDISQLSKRVTQSGVRVGVSLVIQSLDGYVLLTKRPKTMRGFPNIWVTPGGHIEDGETLQQTGVREVCEETGISITDHNIKTLGLWESVYPPVLSMGLPTLHHIVLYMLAQLPQPHSEIELALQEAEVSAAAWLDTQMVAEIVKSDDYGRTRSSPNCYFRAKVIENGQQVDKNLPLSPLMACMPESPDWTAERLSSGSKFALRRWMENRTG